MSVIPQQEKIAPAYLFYFQRTSETVWILIYNRNWLLQHHLTQFPFYFFIYTQGYNDLSDFIQIWWWRKLIITFFNSFIEIMDPLEERGSVTGRKSKALAFDNSWPGSSDLTMTIACLLMSFRSREGD